MALNWKREPWRKLYTREEGSFKSLPLFSRALAGLLLKIADEHGLIHAAGRTPAEAIAFQLGADLADRRILPRHVDNLLRDGYLVLLPSRDLQIRNLIPAQTRWDRVRGEHTLDAEHSSAEREITASRSRVSRETAVSQPREPREPSARTEPSAHDPPTSPAPLDPKRNDTRRDKERSAKRPVSMPAEWEPDETGRKKAAALGLDVAREAEAFRDWTAAKSKLFADWQAAFRTHLNSQAERRDRGGGASSSQGYVNRPLKVFGSSVGLPFPGSKP